MQFNSIPEMLDHLLSAKGRHIPHLSTVRESCLNFDSATILWGPAVGEKAQEHDTPCMDRGRLSACVHSHTDGMHSTAM